MAACMDSPKVTKLMGTKSYPQPAQIPEPDKKARRFVSQLVTCKPSKARRVRKIRGILKLPDYRLCLVLE